MKQIGLKFMLDGMQFLSVVLSEDRAMEIMKKWSATRGESMPHSINNLEDTNQTVFWSVNTSKIQCIHTFNPADLQQQTQKETPTQVGPAWMQYRSN